MTVPSTSVRIGRAAAVVVAGVVFGVSGSFGLAAAEHSAPASPPQQMTEPAAVAEWARTQELTGLSPASLTAPDRATAIDDDDRRLAAEIAAIAEFARAKGLTGLSPATME